MFVVFVIIWKFLSSNCDAVYPVPPGKVTLSNCTMSPTFRLWEFFVIVHVGDPFVVAIVAEVKVVLSGVISNSCPSKYNNTNLSVPIATYLLPLRSTKACIFLVTPTIVSVTRDDHPPTFSGKLYLNLTLSESIHLNSAPESVFCLSIPGKTLKSIRATC